MASLGTVQGAGGASAFVDAQGRLRLAYHSYWWAENRTNAPVAHPRRLNIATLTVKPDRTLEVASLKAG